MSKQQKPFLAYRSFYTPLNTIEKFAKIGYDTLCLFPAHTQNSRGTPYSQYPPMWKWFDRVDTYPFDEMIRNVSRPMPDAKILCMIDMNSPVWLEHMYPFDCCDTFNNLGKAIHNPLWEEATRSYLKTFLEYADKTYGDRITAYILACGATDEWYDYSGGTEDPHRREAWRKYCIAKGLPDPVDIPPASVRDRFIHDGLLRDPQRDAIAVEYWKFCNEAIADSIIRFAKLTREVIHDRAQIGCFYGYIVEKTEKTLVHCGHLAYEKVLDSGLIDFLISPGTYEDREIGGGSGFLTPHGTAAVRGRRLLHECDQRTHTYNSYLAPDINLRLNTAWPDECSTIAGLKREAALGLTCRTNLWWFDMWGDYYQGENVMNTLKQIRELWTEYAPAPAVDVCETAMIVDPDSTYFLNEDHKCIFEMNVGTRSKLYRSGVPWDTYSFNDLPLLKNIDQYKFFVFTSCFNLTPEKQLILEKEIFARGKTALFLGPAGIIRNGVYDPGNCKKLTGNPLAGGTLQYKDFGTWKCYSLEDYFALTPEMLNKIAAEAGVHIYIPCGNPVYAEGNLLAIHTKDGGNIEINVRQKAGTATELFTGKTFKITGNHFTYSFSCPDTALFRLDG
ncbi:MAG: hypothetical protein IJZ19_06980 [Lentisphaeria bacterium]|nr:hypothetical protein [Lentisphaeria bacterium]